MAVFFSDTGRQSHPPLQTVIGGVPRGTSGTPSPTHPAIARNKAPQDECPAGLLSAVFGYQSSRLRRNRSTTTPVQALSVMAA